jgi:predicted PurR-regulated permease PerM
MPAKVAPGRRAAPQLPPSGGVAFPLPCGEETVPSDAELRRDAAPPGSGPLWVIAAVAVLAVLQVGRDVFIPMALALLLAVVLIPPARLLQRAGLPRALAVLLLLVLTLGTIGGVLLLVTSQVLTLAADLPSWEVNLREKLRALSDGSGVLDRAMGTLRRLSEELGGGAGATDARTPVAPASASGGTLEALFDMAGMIAAPAASLAIALLLMAYLLMQREDVRDRFLRLAGMRDIHRTTRAMADATERVGRYLLMQMLMNGIFGLGMGTGLALIGVPNAPLWGVLAFVLRFIPFLGAWVALSLPLVVAVATGSGWTEPLLVLGVFAVVDGVVTHVLEPMLYGRSTGISPLALLVSSALWTVLWGPVGLLLAPPITACLAILGRHVPALAFLEIVLGNTEALPAPLRFYQRHLADDQEGAMEIAELHAEAQGAGAALRDLVLPAVAALSADQAEGALSAATARRISDGLVAVSLALVADEPQAPDAPALRPLPAAGTVDRALAAAAGAAARLGGWRIAAEGEPAALALLCLARPFAAQRLRRAVAQAAATGGEVVGFAPEDPAAAQLADAIHPAPVLRGLEALAARLGSVARIAAAEPATAPSPRAVPSASVSVA